MNAALTLLLLVGATLNIAGRLYHVRGPHGASAYDRMPFVGGALVLLGGIAAILWGLGVPVAPRAWQSAMGVGHGAFEASTQLVGMWALGGGVAMLAGERVRSAAAGRWAALATSLVGLGPVIFAVWLVFAPAQSSLGLASQSEAVLAASNGTLLAAGLAFILLSALLVSYDAVLTHASWLALGLLCAAAVAAVVLGYSNATDSMAAFLPLTDAHGVPVELRFMLVEDTWLSIPAVDTSYATTLGAGLIVVAVVAAAAGLVGSFVPRHGRLLFALASMASIIVLAQLLGELGPRALPDLGSMHAMIKGAGVSPDVLVGVPQLSSETVALHPASVSPIALVLWFLAVVCAFRAMAPIGTPDHLTASYRPSQALALSRDAVAVGAVLMWAGLAVGLFGSVELTGRYVTSHQLGGFVAIAALALASVMAWHGALSKPSRTAFGAWCVMPAMTLVVAALVMLSGIFTRQPAIFLSVLP